MEAGRLSSNSISSIYQLGDLREVTESERCYESREHGIVHPAELTHVCRPGRPCKFLLPSQEGKKIKINPYLKSKIDPSQEQKRDSWISSPWGPSRSQMNSGVCGSMTHGSQLGPAAQALALDISGSGQLVDFLLQVALKKNPKSIIPIYLSPPLTPFISVHFPSCCANGVWLSHSIKEDIKLYSIIFPLSLSLFFSPALLIL